MTRITSQVTMARAAIEWLRDELFTLTPEQWQTPDACGVWSVADVAAHLIWVADLYSDGIRRGLACDVEPSRDVAIPRNPVQRSAEIAEIASAYHDRLGDQVLNGFVQTNLALAELFEDLGPTDWARPAYHPAGVGPIRRLLARYILEVCVHGWDMLHRIARDVALPTGSFQPLIEMLPSYAQARFVQREPLLEPERHLVVLGPPVSATVHLHLYGDRFEMDPTSDGAEHDGAPTMDPLTYVLLFMGRLNWQQAIETGTVSVTGRQEFTVGLLPWFRLA